MAYINDKKSKLDNIRACVLYVKKHDVDYRTSRELWTILYDAKVIVMKYQTFRIGYWSLVNRALEKGSKK